MKTEELQRNLRSEYKYKIEMHAHTKPASTCSEIEPKKMVELYSHLGYDAVVITNHYIYDYNLFRNKSKKEGLELYLKDYYDTVEAAKNSNIKILLGAEIRFTENMNDYLIYGINEQMLAEIYDLLPNGIEKFRQEYKMPNSVFVQAHPFRDGMEEVNPALLDGMETFNMHPGHNSRVALATKYAKEKNIKITSIGSDFHHLNRGHEGVTALLSKTLPNDSFELAQILKSGDYLFEVGGKSIIIP